MPHPYRPMTEAEIDHPAYHLAWLAIKLQQELAQPRPRLRPPRGTWPAEMVMDAVERLEGRPWPRHPDRRPKTVRFREDLTGALRALSRASYPEIGAMLNGRHSSIWSAHGRFKKRPQAERDEFLDRVRRKVRQL